MSSTPGIATNASDIAASELATIVGETHVAVDPALCAGFAVDGMKPRYVVHPGSAEQVASVLKCCADHDLAVIPGRNLTKIGTGNPPLRYDVALSLKEMNQVWYYEPADLVISVEPGMKFGDFQHFVARHKLWLPLDPAGGARASIGGILAANSAGPLRTAYGGPRDMVLGMKIATTDGKIIKTGGRVVKNVTGYDIAKLLIGSHGTLGVIVEASFKLFPMPAERATFVLPAGTLGIARDLRRRVQQSPLGPMRAILLDAEAAKLALGNSARAAEVRGPEIWIEAGGSAQVLERYAQNLGEIGRGAGISTERLENEIAESAWSRISDLRATLAASHPELIVLKAALPIVASEVFVSQAQQHAANEALRVAAVAQVSVGVTHLCLLDGTSKASLPGLIQRLRSAAIELDGSLVVEHCPAEVKANIDAWGATGDDFEMMRKLKQTFDPKMILSPGRFVGGL